MNCPECGKELQPNYNFCPGCGIALNGTEQFKQIVDESFTKLEEFVQGDAMLRLENLSHRLDTMEEELELFLTSAPGKK